MLISPSVLEQIRQHSDIVAVVGACFNLRPSGSTFKALCPFHKEKTPSFIVNPQRQIYHCFGCGAGGDVFRFVMEYEKVDFLTAVKMLAQRAGVRLEFEERAGGPAGGKEKLYELNELVTRLYHDSLRHEPAAAPARDYLRARELGPSAIERFQLGYAPDRWDTVLSWARNKFTVEQLQATGLVLTAAGETARWYDRFRHRLMFPIQDEQGRVLGFSGRLLGDSGEQGAKYVNTPETPLFHKGRVLYGLHQARRAIVEAREVIICEGQIDVIRCHLAGFTTAVAAQGTAFTEEHARILKRYADSALLVLDADRAGQDAALRAAGVFLAAGLAVRIAALPAGEDPDTLIRRPQGAEQFQQLLKNAHSAIAFQVAVLRARADGAGEAGLLRLTAAVLDTISHAPNAVQQEHLLLEAAGRLGVSPDALQREWRKRELREPRGRPAAETPPAAAPGPPPRELALAEHLAAEPALSAWVRDYLPLELLENAQCRSVVRLCLSAAAGGRGLLELAAAEDNAERDLAQFIARLLATPAKVKGNISTSEESVKSLILGLHRDDLRRRRQALEPQLRAAAAGERRRLELEYCQMGYDLARLQNWESALPVLEISGVSPKNKK